jgi:(p)ppGpp synthase/HD superfamily hydrolase
MSTASKLEEAILFAVKCHEGQRDIRENLPFVLHPLRVMNRVRRAGGGELEMIVAVLHDIYKYDQDLGHVEVMGKFGPVVEDALTILTRVPSASYTDFIRLIGNNKNRRITTMVALANIADNLSLGKTHPLAGSKQARLTKRYLQAQKYLYSILEETGNAN